jgi:hypothetical protein
LHSCNLIDIDDWNAHLRFDEEIKLVQDGMRGKSNQKKKRREKSHPNTASLRESFSSKKKKNSSFLFLRPCLTQLVLACAKYQSALSLII